MDFSTLVLIVTALGLYFAFIAWRRARRRRLVASTGNGLFAFSLLAVAMLMVLAALNVRTYQRLTHEQLAADLMFTQVAAGAFEAQVTPPGESPRRYRLEGEEWQLDARIIKWKGFANVAGLDTLYRLDRLSARHHDLERERSGPRSVHALAEDPGLDLWKLAQSYGRWLPWMDAQYGSAIYLPMANGAHYQAYISQSGLVARPINKAANDAVLTWRYGQP